MKNERIIIEKIVPGGQGLGTLPDGRKIFLWNALPGEVVSEYEITKKKSHYVEGVAKRIAGFKDGEQQTERTEQMAKIDGEGSPERVEPKDKCYLATSPWQIMSYEAELKYKAEMVQEVFRQNGLLVALPEVVTDGKVYGYRNKMEYSLYYDKELKQILPAFHLRGSHRKVPVKQSSIERPELWARAMEIIDELNVRGEEARKYQSLILRSNQAGEVQGGLLENKKPHPVFPLLRDTILGQEYSYSPNGFFQINLPVYELALMEIQKYVKTEKVLDLYAGVGTIGLSVARDKELVLVECNKFAFSELERNIRNGNDAFLSSRGPLLSSRDSSLPSNYEGSPKAILSNSEEALEYIQPEQTVIVDPPRAGCDEKLIERLNEVKPERIVYLSCNPATQARDVKKLSEQYKIVAMKAFNFFPRTPHVETICLMSRVKV